VLLVDDSAPTNFFHEFLIKKTQCAENILSFRNGKEALSYIIECEKNGGDLPELILLDINMPIMNGWKFLEEFNRIESEKLKKVKTIMLTSSLLQEDKERALAFSNVNDFLIKPLEEDHFIHLIAKHF
jgi:CheY-like chemotaxis protein